jgi:hypothetical protein
MREERIVIDGGRVVGVRSNGVIVVYENTTSRKPYLEVSVFDSDDDAGDSTSVSLPGINVKDSIGIQVGAHSTQVNTFVTQKKFRRV